MATAAYAYRSLGEASRDAREKLGDLRKVVTSRQGEATPRQKDDEKPVKQESSKRK